jgi:FkbM family methyltransferase
MKRESSSKWQWFIPVVRLSPRSTFALRFRNKITWITQTCLGIFLSKLRIQGARIVGTSILGNIFLEFNVDTLLGKKGQKIMMPKDLVLFESVRAKGFWEPSIVSFLSQPLMGIKAEESIAEYTLLDIGANCGLITRQVANLAKQNFNAVCIEPLAQNFEALQFNVSSLPRILELSTLAFALGDVNCEMDIYTEKANIGNTSFLKMKSRNVTKSKVSQKSTSEFIDENLNNKTRIILKCDTQGYETEILSQFSDSFWQRIDFGVVEIRSLPSLNQLNVEYILNFLKHYPTMFWIDGSTQSNVKVSEVREFWLSKTNEELDLCFSKVI